MKLNEDSTLFTLFSDKETLSDLLWQVDLCDIVSFVITEVGLHGVGDFMT